MYDQILYPTDGSDGAAAAVENVRDLAQSYGATVHVLHVADTEHDALGLSGDPMKEDGQGMTGHPEGGESAMAAERGTNEELRTQIEEHGVEVVDEVTAQLGDVGTRTEIRHGDPVETILDYSDEHDVDMVVMGTHGRTGLDRYLIGSVTEKVVRLSDVPVLTVRRDE